MFEPSSINGKDEKTYQPSHPVVLAFFSLMANRGRCRVSSLPLNIMKTTDETRQGGYTFITVCSFLCLSVNRFGKTTGPIFMKLGWV